ncbi:MAG: hypothetical protein PHY31_04025 [Smithellaceae bacterium]|nr:hypothetical protein [Smithellaceae bacterium]
MNRYRSLVWYVCIAALLVATLFLPTQNSLAKEETAHLVFEKTALSRQKAGIYIVKKGDWVTNIIRRELGIKAKTEWPRMYRLIKKMNPQIKDLNRIYPGQKIKLPLRTILPSAPVAHKEPSTTAVSPTPSLVSPLPILVVPKESSILILSEIIRRMHGSVTSSGSYYIPLTSGQVSVDCKKTPVVEFDDGSIVLADFSGQIPEPLRRSIQTQWKNYRVVQWETGGVDVPSMLQRIINASDLYTMKRVAKPVTVADGETKVDIFVDWLISKDGNFGEKVSLQGVSFFEGVGNALPAALVRYAAEKGLTVTDVTAGSIARSSTEESPLMADHKIAAVAKGEELSYELLSKLGFSPSRNVDVKVFDRGRDGFNLFIKGDIVLSLDGRSTIISSREFPRQFIDRLKQDNKEVVYLPQGESLKAIVEKTLQASNCQYTDNRFSFPIPRRTTPVRALITLPALKVDRAGAGPLYVLDFRMNGLIHSVLQEEWGFRSIEYDK